MPPSEERTESSPQHQVQMALLVGCHVEGAEGYKLAKVSVRRKVVGCHASL